MVLAREDAMKLTKSVVEGLPAPALGYTLHWDGQLKGFGGPHWRTGASRLGHGARGR